MVIIVLAVFRGMTRPGHSEKPKQMLKSEVSFRLKLRSMSDGWEVIPLPSEPKGQEFSHYYVVWAIEGRPELGSSIYCATSERGWRQFVRLLPFREYRREDCHLRRFETLRAALEAYLSEAERFGCDASPRLRLC